MNLILMLTHNDMTVKNAKEVFLSCADLPARHWGFKDVGLPVGQMKDLVATLKSAGKTTYLEVVTYTEEECLRGARLAIDCGFDYLMGTLYYPSVAAVLKTSATKYFPFCGKVWGSPSSLGDTIEGIINDAVRFEELGIDGTDILAYRFIGDKEDLLRQFVAKVKLPTVVAGSINSYKRLDLMKKLNPWGFTIGSALFTSDFVHGGSFRENLEAVMRYMGDDLMRYRDLVKDEMKELTVEATHKLFDTGMGPVLDGGDLSIKDPDTGLIYVDPRTSQSFKIPNWRCIRKEDIVVVDGEGNIIDGGAGRMATVELPMHLAIYKARPETNAIVHAHGLYSSVFAAIGKGIKCPLVETAIFAGDDVVCAEYGKVASKELADNIVKALGSKHQSALLRQHGAVYLGKNIDDAFTVGEFVERAAQINIMARAMNETILDLPAVVH